ncbi:nuclear protein MDM1 isoform X2 [Stigmatopora nigra]
MPTPSPATSCPFGSASHSAVFSSSHDSGVAKVTDTPARRHDSHGRMDNGLEEPIRRVGRGDERRASTCVLDARSPLLRAQQVLQDGHTSRMRPVRSKVPTVSVKTQTNPFPELSQPRHAATETEYRRSFQAASPSREPRMRKYVDRRPRLPRFHTRTKNQKDQEELENLLPQRHGEPAHHREAPPEPRIPRRRRKLTEYQDNFPTPLRLGADETPQVALLRKDASWYRRRDWGTNLFPDHLSQLRSQFNVLWEASADVSARSGPAGSGPAGSEPALTPRVESLDLAGISTSSSGSESPPRPRRQTSGTRGRGGLVSPEEAFQKRSVGVGTTSCRAASSRRRPRTTPARAQSPAPPPTYVIQGQMRHAEFQHNGELGLKFRSHQCSLWMDQDRRLSFVSELSAASRSAAAGVLERAGSRGRQFWDES